MLSADPETDTISVDGEMPSVSSPPKPRGRKVKPATPPTVLRGAGVPVRSVDGRILTFCDDADVYYEHLEAWVAGSRSSRPSNVSSTRSVFAYRGNPHNNNRRRPKALRPLRIPRYEGAIPTTVAVTSPAASKRAASVFSDLSATSVKTEPATRHAGVRLKPLLHRENSRSVPLVGSPRIPGVIIDNEDDDENSFPPSVSELASRRSSNVTQISLLRRHLCRSGLGSDAASLTNGAIDAGSISENPLVDAVAELVAETIDAVAIPDGASRKLAALLRRKSGAETASSCLLGQLDEERLRVVATLGRAAAELRHVAHLGQDVASSDAADMSIISTWRRLVGFGAALAEDGVVAESTSVALAASLRRAVAVKLYPVILKAALLRDDDFKEAQHVTFYSDQFGESKFLIGSDNWELLNLPCQTSVKIYERVREKISDAAAASAIAASASAANFREKFRRQSLHHRGIQAFAAEHSLHQGGVFVCSESALDVVVPVVADLGFGEENVKTIPVDEVGRFNLQALSQQLLLCEKLRVPVFAVVVFVHSDGACLEPLADLQRLRLDMAKAGVSFWIHGVVEADAAMVMSLNDANEEDVECAALWRRHLLGSGVDEALRAVSAFESLSLDPNLYRGERTRILLYHESCQTSVEMAGKLAGGTESDDEDEDNSDSETRHADILEGIKLSYALIGGLTSHSMASHLASKLATARVFFAFVFGSLGGDDLDEFEMRLVNGVAGNWISTGKSKGTGVPPFKTVDDLLKSNKGLLLPFLANGPQLFAFHFGINLKGNQESSIQKRLTLRLRQRWRRWILENPDFESDLFRFSTSIWNKRTNGGLYSALKRNLRIKDEWTSNIVTGSKTERISGATIKFCDVASMSVAVTRPLTFPLPTTLSFLRSALRNELLQTCAEFLESPTRHEFVILTRVDDRGRFFAEHLIKFQNRNSGYHAILEFELATSDVIDAVRREQDIFAKETRQNNPFVFFANKLDLRMKDVSELRNDCFEAEFYFSHGPGLKSLTTGKVSCRKIVRCQILDPVEDKAPKGGALYFLFTADSASTTECYLSHVATKLPDFQHVFKLSRIPNIRTGTIVTLADISSEPCLSASASEKNHQIFKIPLTKHHMDVSFTDLKSGSSVQTTIALDKNAAQYFDSNKINWDT